MPTISLPDDEFHAVERRSGASSRTTGFRCHRGSIRCARRWQGSMRPQSQPCSRRRAGGQGRQAGVAITPQRVRGRASTMQYKGRLVGKGHTAECVVTESPTGGWLIYDVTPQLRMDPIR